MENVVTDAPPLTEEDIEAFIITLNESEDELACEYDHGGRTVCSVAVTHKCIDCRSSYLNCLVAAQDITLRGITETCKYCTRPGYVCWHSIPFKEAT